MMNYTIHWSANLINYLVIIILQRTFSLSEVCLPSFLSVLTFFNLFLVRNHIPTNLITPFPNSVHFCTTPTTLS